MNFSPRKGGSIQTQCFQFLFGMVLVEIVLGFVLTMLAVTLLVFVAFEKELFMHVFGFAEGILAVIAGSVGLFASRKKYLKRSRPYLVTHATLSGTAILLLLIDTAAVTPPIIQSILVACSPDQGKDLEPLKYGQSYMTHDTMQSLYLAALVIHVLLLLSLIVTESVSLILLRVCCSQKGSYDTTGLSNEVTEAERL